MGFTDVGMQLMVCVLCAGRLHRPPLPSDAGKAPRKIQQQVSRFCLLVGAPPQTCIGRLLQRSVTGKLLRRGIRGSAALTWLVPKDGTQLSSCSFEHWHPYWRLESLEIWGLNTAFGRANPHIIIQIDLGKMKHKKQRIVWSKLRNLSIIS